MVLRFFETKRLTAEDITVKSTNPEVYNGQITPSCTTPIFVVKWIDLNPNWFSSKLRILMHFCAYPLLWRLGTVQQYCPIIESVRGSSINCWFNQATSLVSSHASLPNLSESSQARWAAVSSFASAQPSTYPSRALVLTAHQPDWIQTNLATTSVDKTCWLDWMIMGDHHSSLGY